MVELFVSLADRTPWCIAGGYAIELFVGRPLRPHGDVDVLLLRRDQHVVHEVLPGWDIAAADPPGRLRPWAPAEVLPLAPEVQLFYKATSSEVRAKDRSDFGAALPLLDEAARRWPDTALAGVRPDHPWRDRLACAETAPGGQ